MLYKAPLQYIIAGIFKDAFISALMIELKPSKKC